MSIGRVIALLREFVEKRHTGVVVLKLSFNQGGIRSASLIEQKETKIA